MPGGGHSPEYDFNEQKPAGTDYVYEIDNWVISNQQHIDNALAVEHYSPSNDPDESGDDYGRHDFITLKEQAVKPSLAGSTNRHALYAKANGLYVEDESGDELLIVTFGTPSVAAFPSGTMMLFGKNGANLIPTGWTRSTAWQDGAVICHKDSGDPTTGGTNDFRTLATHHAQSHTLTVSEMPIHKHGIHGRAGYANIPTGNAECSSFESNNPNIANHPGIENAGGGGGHTHNGLLPYYQEVASATKD